MYELDGIQYSFEQVTIAAKESNLTLEDYLARSGIVKKTTAQSSGVVAGNELNGGLDLGTGSSESQNKLNKNVKDPKIKKPKITKQKFDQLEEEQLVSDLKILYPDMEFDEDGVPFRDGLKVKVPGDENYTTIPLNTQYNQNLYEGAQFLKGDAYASFLEVAERSKNTKGLDRDVWDASNGAISNKNDWLRFNTTNMDVRLGGEDKDIDGLILNPKVGEDKILDVLATVEGNVLDLFQNPIKVRMADGSFEQDSTAILRKMRGDLEKDELNLIRDQAFVNINKSLSEQGLPPLLEDDYQELFRDSYKKIQNKANAQADALYNTMQLPLEEPKDKFYESVDLNFTNNLAENDQSKVGFENKKLKLIGQIRDVERKISNDPTNELLIQQRADLVGEYNLIPDLIKNIAEGENVSESTYFPQDQIDSNPIVKQMQGIASNANKDGKDIADNLYKNDRSKTRQEYAVELYKDKVFDLQRIQALGAKETFELDANKMKSSVTQGGKLSGGISINENKKVSINNPVLRKLMKAGFFPDKNGKIQVSAFDLQQAGVTSRKFEGWADEFSSKEYMSDANIAKIKAYEEQWNERYSEAKGLFRLSKLNVDPSKIEKNGFFGNIAATGGRAMLTQWFDLSTEQAEKILTGDEFVRTSLDRFSEAENIYNSSEEVQNGTVGKMELTTDQKENLAKTWSEDISEGVGNFVPMIIELGAITYASGGTASATGFARVLNGLKGGNKFQKATYHTYKAMLEEAKMQVAFDMKPGGGATFYGLGALTSSPLKGKFAWMNGIYHKVLKAGPIGAVSTKTAALTEALYDDAFKNNLDFNKEFNEMFSDGDEFLKTSFIDMMVFKISGAHTLRTVDFRTTQNKRNLIKTSREKRDALLGVGKKGRNKKFKNLTEKEKDLYNSYESTMQTMHQMVMTETYSARLDPKSKAFESNFRKMQADPINQVMKELIPDYKGFEVKFVTDLTARTDNIMAANEKALFVKSSNKNQKDIVYINKDKYTIGVGLHEFGHVVVENWSNNQKNQFIEKAGNMFKNIDFNIPDRIVDGKSEGPRSIKGSDLRKLIKKEYSKEAKTDKDIVSKELLSYIIEFTANPEFYYSNPNAASSFLKEIKLEVQDYIREKGYFKKMLAPKTAGDVVRLLAQIGQSSRNGEPIGQKIKAAFTALDNININTFEMSVLKNNAQLRRAAAKELNSVERLASRELIGNEAKSYLDLKLDNKALLSILEASSSTGEQKGGAVQAIVEKNFGLIKQKLGWQNWGKKGITERGIKDAVTEQILGIFPGRKIPLFKNYDSQFEVSTRLGDVIGKRQGEILERAKQLEELTMEGQSLDGERAAQVADTPSSEFTSTAKEIKKRNLSERLGIKESVDKFINKELGITEKTTTEEKVAIVKESLKDLTYKGTENKIKDIIDAKLTDKFLLDLARRPVLAKELYELALAEGATSKGLSTGVKGKLLEYFYDLSEGKRLDSKDGKSKSGLQRQIKQPFNLDIFKEFVTRGIDPKTGKLERKTDSYLRRLDAFRQEAGKAITNQQMRELGVDLVNRAPELKDMLKRAGDGRAPAMASKILDIAKDIGYKDLNAETISRGLKMLQENQEKFLKDEPKLAEVLTNVSLQYFQGKVKALKGENPTFKSMSKEIPDFIETPFGKISKNEILTEGVGVGMFGQVGETRTVNGKKAKVKLYEWYDTAAIETFLEGNIGKDGVREGGIYGKDGLATIFPKWITEILGTGGTLEQSFGIGTRASGIGVKAKIDSPGSKTPKYEKNTTLEATYSLPQNQKSKLLNAFGTGKSVTKVLDKLRDAVFMGEGVQKKRVLDSWDKLTEKEKVAKLKEAINPKDNQQKADLYFALESIKQEWLYSSKNKKQFIERSQTLLNLASKNSNLVKGYNRQFVPIVAVLAKPGDSKRQLKLEHVKSSLEQSMQATTAIIEGRWIKDGRKIMNDFSGIISTKEFLNEIDKFGGTTNTAGIARMTANLENLKNYKTVESGYNETLYDKVVREAAQEIGAKARELGKPFLKNELARYIENPSPSNKIILDQAVKNKTESKKVFDNNVKIAKEAGVKANNNAEIMVELAKKDKQNAKETKERFASKDLGKEFNDIIEQSSGVESQKQYSDIRAKSIGKNKRKLQFFIPDSAADLNGLIDVTLGKGKKGNAQRKWYKDNVITPFNQAEIALTRDRVALTSGFKELKKQLKIVPKDLRKEALDGFTFEQAIRVHTWNKQGMKVEGLSKRDLKDLSEIIEKNPELNAFSDQLIELNKGKGYPAPTKEWLAGSISTDLRTGLNRGGRASYLEATGYTENVNRIYTKENLNKLEAVYGTKYRVALENMLGRMKTGVNRKPSANALENRVLDWINNANGVTMFLNARSAVLQTISSLNYINWTDNNPLKAGKAVANQPQYWKDFMEIMNSDYLVDRRNGLKLNVSESEIADAAKSSTNSAKGAISYLLSKGFMFTRIADSFAIASGGSTFYRNRINTYKKQGLNEAQAKEKAFNDFREISEVSQQSANVSKISMEQSTSLGRLVLAFANTPMQYARLQKSAIKDLANGRGDYKSNFSKIMYYGLVQNLMFNALQNALFTNIWEDNPDPMKEEMKQARIANGMADSILRGMGIGGAGVSTLKNIMLKIKSESEKSRPKYEKAALEVFDFLPPIDSKVKKLISAGTSMTWDKNEIRGKSLMDPSNPAWLAGANVISAGTNFPADRIIKKVTNMKGVMTEEMEMWQRIARFAGWSEWEIGPNKSSKKGKSKFNSPVFKAPTFKTPVFKTPKF
mgnify:FL=1|jgi:hypothetical protein|tara:strand:- start:131 stop:8434 length:8304 start_codon:yes stop_codon:yes gene_type:complete